LKKHADSILEKVPKHRLLSLDVFRGIAITGMILVNNPGSWSHIYAPLKHAQWHGWTVTDLVFPFFLFIVGVAIHLSISKQLLSQTPHRDIIKSSAIRMFKLLLLGWFLGLFFYRFGNNDFSWIEDKLFMIRYMGVLQRIGIVYFITALLFLFFRPGTMVAWAVALMVIYTVLMQFMPYSDDAGVVYQGLWLKGNNFSAWLDHNLLGADHLYGKTSPFAYDPEGLLSTLPAIATCLSGVLVGHYLQRSRELSISLNQQVKQLLFIGLMAVIFGQLLHNWIPINKALWTPSYVILTSGLACVVLALCIYLLDIKHYKAWAAPFVVFGANSIAFFMFAGISGRLLLMIPVAGKPLKAWLYTSIYQPLFGELNGSLAFAISFLLVSYLLMLWMYRKNIFWKV